MEDIYMNSNVLSSKKRMMFLLYFSVVFAIILIIKVAHLQFIMAPTLMEKIALQQSSSRNITPNRGTIYDSTEKNILAMSSTVESVTVNPVNISNENKEKVARKLAELFELDYEKILKKVKKHSSIENIIKRVDKEKTNELRRWMQENNILSGINIDEDTKRYYPNSDFASHIIGFCGSDNQGLDGIEAKYDEILKGKNGKISKYIDAKGNEFGNEGEVYENPIDGNDLVLSIDFNIQSIVEKYLEEACIDNVCTDGGNVIMMNPKNGDILAMATYPYYDLNSPYEINSEELKEVWELLELGEKSKNLQAMWRNKAIADTYEPGSTFKLVTASASIEEGLATPDKKGVFNCGGGIEIAGRRIKCWRYYRPHGAQSLREGLMNSCNPVFIGLGQKMGVNKYYKYLDKFGFLKKTGIDLPGEAGSIFLKEEKVGPVELATISFGQRFEVTPIQMITMVSTIANNGRYVKPRVVKKVIDSVTGEVTEIEPEFGEQVIKSETAKDILSMMTSVVAEGTGKNARVEGYNVGGKTGTSEDGVNTGKYVTSFIGVAPTDDPQIAILVTLYNPTGEGGHQGGGVAAPVAGKILSEVINYLEIKPNNNEEL
jgi:stage V sporulation protein D (sporulation-specific penicillin-binding protein)